MMKIRVIVPKEGYEEELKERLKFSTSELLYPEVSYGTSHHPKPQIQKTLEYLEKRRKRDEWVATIVTLSPCVIKTAKRYAEKHGYKIEYFFYQGYISWGHWRYEPVSYEDIMREVRCDDRV